MAVGATARTAQELHGPIPTEAATTAAPPAAATARHWPQLIPVAQLLAVVLGVMAIIWNQQQTTDNLRTELRTEISALENSLRADMAELRAELRADMAALENSLRADMAALEASLRAEIAELRVEVRSNGERLARIEGFLEIGIPEEAAVP